MSGPPRPPPQLPHREVGRRVGWGSYTVLQGMWTQRRTVGRMGWGGGVGGGGGEGPLVTVRHLKVISALPFPCITYWRLGYDGDDSLPTVCASFIIGIKEVSECCFLSLYLHKECKVEN